MILYPLFNISFSSRHVKKHEVITTMIMLVLALFFITVDILRTYWNLTVSLGETTNLIFLWRLLEPITAVLLAAVSGFGSLDHAWKADSGVGHDDRGWIEIDTVGKSTSK